jgi:hypothetical protein
LICQDDEEVWESLYCVSHDNKIHLVKLRGWISTTWDLPKKPIPSPKTHSHIIW